MLLPQPLIHNRILRFSVAGGLLIFTALLIRWYHLSDRFLVTDGSPPSAAPDSPPAAKVQHPIYKPHKETEPVQIKDNFPRAEKARSRTDLPLVPSWNTPPEPHVSEPTPLFIGFTRNWRLLQQAVVSFITAGWPPEDIYVVENTGTMDANKNVQLSLQNPFYIDYYRLTDVFGVNVLTTPTLLTFAQLQNFFLYEAITKEYPAYFWAHMDVAALSDEKREPDYRALYNLSVETLRESQHPRYGRWAIRFFAYDHLTLVNTKAYVETGGWDTQIPFYMTDCDMHERLAMRGFKMADAHAGAIFDIAESIDDLEELYRKKEDNDGEDDELGSERFSALFDKFAHLGGIKATQKGGRNTWQAQQSGGQGEPYYRDPEGFDIAIGMTIEHGRQVFAEKWGHRACDLRGVGLRETDAWRVEHDWDRPPDEAGKHEYLRSSTISQFPAAERSTKHLITIRGDGRLTMQG